MNHPKWCCFCWPSPALISVRPSDGIRNKHRLIIRDRKNIYSSNFGENKSWRYSMKTSFNDPFLMNWLHNEILKMGYCWWKKSCTTWDVEDPGHNGKNYQPQLVQDFFHQQHCTFNWPIFVWHLLFASRDVRKWRRQPGRTLAKALGLFNFCVVHVALGCGMGKCGRDTICIMYTVYVYTPYVP